MQHISKLAIMIHTIAGSGRFQPTPLKGDTKYGTNGGCAAELLSELKLPTDVAESVAKYGNLAITKKHMEHIQIGESYAIKMRK